MTSNEGQIGKITPLASSKAFDEVGDLRKPKGSGRTGRVFAQGRAKDAGKKDLTQHRQGLNTAG